MTWFTLSVTGSTPGSSLFGQIDQLLLIRGAGSPVGTVAAGLTGQIYFDTTNLLYYQCITTDGSGVAANTTWVPYGISINNAAPKAGIGSITVPAAASSINGILSPYPRPYSLVPTTEVEYSTTTTVWDLCTAVDGNMWYATRTTKVGQVTMTGTVTEFSTISNTYDICSGADNFIWYATNTNKVGTISTTGTGNVEYPTTSNSTNICTGSDGNIWYGTGTTKIGRVTPAGTVTEFTTTSPCYDVCAGPDGSIWYATQTTKLGKMPTTGTGAIEYNTTTATYTVCSGPDSNLWYGTNTTKIGKISTLGLGNTEYSTTTSIAGSHVASGIDGYLWYCTGTTKIGRISTNGTFNTEYTTVSNTVSNCAGGNGAMWSSTGTTKIISFGLTISTSGMTLSNTPLAITSGGTGSATGQKWAASLQAANFTANGNSCTDYRCSQPITVTLTTSPADGTVYRISNFSSGSVIVNTSSSSNQFNPLITGVNSYGTSLTLYTGEILDIMAVTGGWDIN